jgi:sirohydrochlorin ferrochelatase
MPEPVLVAVAHGSADPRAAAAIGALMPLAATRAAARGLAVPDLRVAYLGHAAPSLPQVMGTIDPGAPVTVLPLLLTAAYHSKTDIPRALDRAGGQAGRAGGQAGRAGGRAGRAGGRAGRAGGRAGRITYGDPLGPHPLLLRALERRLAEVDPAALEHPGQTAVVLAAAGSSDPQANATIARLAARWQASTGWRAVQAAYASTAGPDPATAVTGLLAAGARRVVVASYLLAPGFFADRIRRGALGAGAAAVSPALGACEEVADVVIDRYTEAGTPQRTAA